jgi:tRNA nucleotidyltransferase (CCA-adding enzyme)
MLTLPAGFREIEHTADWELKAWGPDINILFEQAARGMYALCGARWLAGASQKRAIEINAADNENLLVSFLSELLYIYEQEGLGFNQFDIRITDKLLRANLEGTAVSAFEKEIKAVTYHNLLIHQSDMGWEVNIVFDV